jgi:hypothetical protein
VPDDLRPEVVAALSEPGQLPAGLVDQVLDASDTERAAAELADRTRSFLEHAGILKPSTSVLDLHHDQVQLLAAVYGLMVSWWAQPGYRDRPLGHMLKVVPADVADATGQLLRWAGLLAPEVDELEE